MRVHWTKGCAPARAVLVLLLASGLSSCATQLLWKEGGETKVIATRVTRMQVGEILVWPTAAGVFQACVRAHSPDDKLPRRMRGHDGRGNRWFVLEPIGEDNWRLPDHVFVNGEDSACEIRIQKYMAEPPTARLLIRGPGRFFERECTVRFRKHPPVPREGSHLLPAGRSTLTVKATYWKIRGGPPVILKILATPLTICADAVVVTTVAASFGAYFYFTHLSDCDQ